MNAKEKLLESIIQNQEPRSPGVHVSTIVFPCLRKGWFERRLGQFGNAKDTITLWIGRGMHGIPMLSQSEVQLSWNGIDGSIDDYDKASNTIIDKKSIKKIYKSYLPKPEHIYQLECYNVLLVKNGFKPVEEAHIVYIEKDPEKHEVVDCNVSKKIRKVEDVAPQMQQAKEQILSESPPPRVVNDWACDYCSFVNQCFTNFKSLEQLLPFLKGVKVTV